MKRSILSILLCSAASVFAQDTLVIDNSTSLYNYSINNMNVSFADEVGGVVTFNSDEKVAYEGSTFNIGERTLNFTNTAGGLQIYLKESGVEKGVAFVGSGVDKSIVNFTSATTYEARSLSVKNASVNFNSAIKSLYLLNTTENSKFYINAESTITSIGQESKSKNGSEIIVGANTTFNTKLGITSYAFTLKDNVIANVTGTCTLSNSKYNTNGNHIMSKLTIGNDAVLTTTRGGIRFVGADINGSLIVQGQGSVSYTGADNFIIGFNSGQVKFGANSYLSQHNLNPLDTSSVTVASESHNWISGTTTVTSNNVNKGALDFGNRLYISKGAKFVMNTTDAYIVGSDESWAATSQADSLFHIETSSGITTGSANNVTFEINALNNIGGFVLNQANVKLNLIVADGVQLIIGEDANTTSFAGTALGADMIVLEGDVYKQVKVYDLSDEQIKNYFTTTNGSEIMVQDAGNGAYWVNTVVPEPAEWAAIFGAVALGFVAYRRRK